MNKTESTHAGLLGKFANPPADRRSVPFWSWNGQLEQGELNAQIEGFKEQGMGGFMMHVREGLETPYMGEDFMARIKQSVAKAKEEGMYAWLYDEDRYSSGMGGGQVARLGGDAVRAKALSLDVCRAFGPDESIQAVYRARIRGDELLDCARLADWTDCGQLAGEEAYLVLRRHVAPPNEWCHGDSYPDSLNPLSAAIFLETTYEKYKEAVGEEFGRTVPGIFTDEPFFRGFQERLNAPEMTWMTWTDALPSTFAEKNGYEIWETLPYFFYRGAPSSKIRHDYWKTVTEMFCDAYTKPIGDWCRDNGLAFAGHFCWEEDLVKATLYNGAVMPHYRYLDVPGIDTLCEQTDESLSVKEASSVANQYGKPIVMTETYGVTGWDLTFEGRKWIGDWQYALGVNAITHHVALYSLRGCRKRDYPPSFNYNANWWPHNHVVEDYFARLGSVLTEGRVVRDVLVVHPATSVWARLGQDVLAPEWRNRAGNAEALADYNRAFNDFVRLLLGEHYDFDLGDELILQEIGSVRGDRMQVGLASYRVVVLPSLLNLLHPTCELLLAYMNAGGILLSYGDVPEMVDGAPSDLSALTEHPGFRKAGCAERLIEAIERELPRSVRLVGEDGREANRLLVMRREMEDCTAVFVANNDREAGYDAEVGIQGSGRVESWDALTGEKTEVAAVSRDGYLVFRERFGRTDSKLYLVVPEPGEAAFQALTEESGVQEPLAVLDAPASFARTAPNALVLDRCQYRVRDEAWSGTMDVWRAQQALRERLGMRQIYANGGLQRHFWIGEPHENDGEPVAFRFVFAVKDVPAAETFIAFEQAERFRFRLNGDRIAEAPLGWYLDRCISTVKLPALIEGDNVLEIECAYMHDMEIEDAFLIGDFSVDGERRLAREPGNLGLGDWCPQGYPHYCGSMIYRFDFDAAESAAGRRTFLEMGSYEAITLRLFVNGHGGKDIPWRAAGTVELTEWLVPGANRLELEVVGSPRNALGPLHVERPDGAWLDWDSFHPQGPERKEDYVLRPYGLTGEIRIYRL
ncbi:glycosyl hydrolase [Paenibacillus sacheonensis]|uniref:Alpha-L-rhamnosidase n=1 Tax=Paenibacillus sacheonensis TaxID=742054 RepID=A0A7X4YL44_9BACL|nr:glycosyl hydrolase [Paenibacillus sacheonensis]MBM7564299.1 hypothetical protein [Paenibacillus sacheonensis]NBC67379.1 hypothetical protein [Paenibacillus sacheonensis]